MTAPTVHIIRGRVNWYGLWTLYVKEVRRFLKVPAQTVIGPMVTTMLFLAVFSLALGGAARMVGSIRFLEFLAPGLVMMAMLQASFANTSSSLMMAKIQGNIIDLLMTPLSAGELTAGLVLGGMTRGLLTGGILLASLQLVVPLTPQHFAIVLFYGAAASMMLALLGVLGGLWAEKFDHISAVTNFVVTPLAFLSGTFYSVDRLPGVWHTVSQFNPFFYAIDGFRYGFIGVADGVLWIGVVVLIAINAVLWLTCLRLITAGYNLKP